MNLSELEEKVRSLEEKVRTLEDIEQINILQRAYGHYVDNMMYDEIADLFINDGTVDLSGRVCLGRESISNYFRDIMFKNPEDGTKRLYVHLQLQGVVHIDQGGQTAKGRWQMLGLATDYLGKPPGELHSTISHGVYENDYVKENSVWKIKKLTFNSSFQATLKDGWVNKISQPSTYSRAKPDVKLDIGDRTWRSGYKMPCHFNNPVTGR